MHSRICRHGHRVHVLRKNERKKPKVTESEQAVSGAYSFSMDDILITHTSARRRSLGASVLAGAYKNRSNQVWGDRARHMHSLRGEASETVRNPCLSIHCTTLGVTAMLPDAHGAAQLHSSSLYYGHGSPLHARLACWCIVVNPNKVARSSKGNSFIHWKSQRRRRTASNLSFITFCIHTSFFAWVSWLLVLPVALLLGSHAFYCFTCRYGTSLGVSAWRVALQTQLNWGRIILRINSELIKLGQCCKPDKLMFAADQVYENIWEKVDIGLTHLSRRKWNKRLFDLENLTPREHICCNK